MKCIFTKHLTVPSSMPNGVAYKFPEKELSLIEQREFDKHAYQGIEYVLTNSPFIVACFHAQDVLVYDDEADTFCPPNSETYGASFEVLMKQLNDIKSSLPQVVVDEVRAHLKMGDSNALAFVEHLGSSAEKAYLLRKLQPRKEES